MPDRMVGSDLMPEVVLWQFLRMRSENTAQHPLKVAFDGKQHYHRCSISAVLVIFWPGLSPINVKNTVYLKL